MVGKMSGKIHYSLLYAFFLFKYFISLYFFILVGICLVAMSPFVILVVVGSFKVDPARWFTLPVQDTGKIVDGRLMRHFYFIC